MVVMGVVGVHGLAGAPADGEVRTINFDGKPHEIRWRTHAMDYNAMQETMHGEVSESEQQTVWSEVPLFAGTQITFLERCGSMSNCVPLEYGHAMVSGYGLMSLLTPTGLRHVAELGIYHWEFDGWSATGGDEGNRTVFRDDTYYVFCLAEKPPPKESGHDTRLYTVPELAENILGIIEITSTFDAPHPNPVLDVTAESLVEYAVTREWESFPDEVEFRVRAHAGRFSWESQDDTRGTVGNTSDAIRMLTYAFRTAAWTPPSDPSIAEKPSPVDTLIRTKTAIGTRKVHVKYFNGTWHFRDEDGRLWSTYYPQLLFKIPGACRGSAGK